MPAMSALGAGFLVAGGAVDLAGEEEVAADLGFERGMELGREGEIVLDGVGGAEDFGVFAADDGLDHLHLDLEREGGREAVDVDFVRRDAFRFEKQLLSLLLREFDDFVFDGGAIARADALDDAGVHAETYRGSRG